MYPFNPDSRIAILCVTPPSLLLTLYWKTLPPILPQALAFGLTFLRQLAMPPLNYNTYPNPIVLSAVLKLRVKYDTTSSRVQFNASHFHLLRVCLVREYNNDDDLMPNFQQVTVQDIYQGSDFSRMKTRRRISMGGA